MKARKILTANNFTVTLFFFKFLRLVSSSIPRPGDQAQPGSSSSSSTSQHGGTFAVRVGTIDGVITHHLRAETRRDLAAWARAIVQGCHTAAHSLREYAVREWFSPSFIIITKKIVLTVIMIIVINIIICSSSKNVILAWQRFIHHVDQQHISSNASLFVELTINKSVFIHSDTIFIFSFTLPGCVWQGRCCQLVVNHEEGFSLYTAGSRCMGSGVSPGSTPAPLWRRSFDKLRLSADDGNRLLWLDFEGEDGEIVSKVNPIDNFLFSSLYLWRQSRKFRLKHVKVTRRKRRNLRHSNVRDDDYDKKRRKKEKIILCCRNWTWRVVQNL